MIVKFHHTPILIAKDSHFLFKCLQTFKKKKKKDIHEIQRSCLSCVPLPFLLPRILSYHYSTDLPFIPQSSVQSTLDLWNLTFLFPDPLLFKMGWKFATSTTLFISSCVHTTALVSYQYRTLLHIGKRQHKIPDQILLLASSQGPAPQPIEDKFRSIQHSSVDVRVFVGVRRFYKIQVISVFEIKSIVEVLNTRSFLDVSESNA